MSESEPILFPLLRKRLKERREKRRKHREESSSLGTPAETRDIIDLVRSQFSFSCGICEDIAEKVSAKLPDRVAKTRVYEAVYQLSSEDKKAQNEAIATLGELNVLGEVMEEIKQGWEQLKT